MAPKYYEAPALVKLKEELNALFPDRDKSSDGWIGDAAHNARKSDHNPDYSAGGVVRARDTDKDGIPVDALVQILIKDDRTQYVIWNGHIWSRTHGFTKRVYTGDNKHTAHLHLSLRHDKKYENSRASWKLSSLKKQSTSSSQKPPVGTPNQAPAFPLPKGYYFGPRSGPKQSVSGYFGYGPALAQFQEKMRSRGWKINVTGRYDDQSAKVIEAFQTEKKLKVDKHVGPQTWAAAWNAPVS